MKKVISLLTLLTNLSLISQTNSFPTSGNVSVGAGTSPTAKLHVLETTVLPTAQNASQIFMRTGGSSGAGNNIYNNKWLVRSESTAADWWTAKVHDALSLDNAYVTPGVDTKTFWERHLYADRQSWGTGSNPYMSLSQGRLGVGIYDPAARLDLQEGNNSYSTFIARNIHTVGGGYCILSNVKLDQTKALAVVNSNTGWVENFVVLGNGQTQIGVKKSTAHANAMLMVDGKVVCKDLYVTATSDWPDFVFKPDYKLPKLTDIETYYKQNGHLPLIPSEREVQENGVNVAEMNKLLLQKIEELTILMVEQDKRIKELENKK